MCNTKKSKSERVIATDTSLHLMPARLDLQQAHRFEIGRRSRMELPSLTIEQKRRLLADMFLGESDECEWVLSALFNTGTDEGRRIIWSMHEFVYTDGCAIPALQEMSVLERVVYENNQRALHLWKLNDMQATAEAEAFERTKGVPYMVQDHIVELPPWAVREVCENYKPSRPATSAEIHEDATWEDELRRKEEEKAAKEKKERLARQAEIWKKIGPRSQAVEEGFKGVWDDEPLCVTVGEMRKILDEDSMDKANYPPSRVHLLKELQWVFNSPLDGAETFTGRQAQYRRSLAIGRYGNGSSRNPVIKLRHAKKSPPRMGEKGAKPY